MPKRSIEDEVLDLCCAFMEGRIPDPVDGSGYYNVKTIQAAGLR